MEEKEKEALQQEENNIQDEAKPTPETVEMPADTIEVETDKHEEGKVKEEANKALDVSEAVDNPLEEVEAPEQKDAATAQEATEDPADTVEVETDEHEEIDEYAAHSKELPDYAHMPLAKLVEEGEHLLNNREIKDIKDEMEALHTAALHILDEERNDKLHAFVDEGGAEIDFVYDQPQRSVIQNLYHNYKQKRHQYYKHLEAELSANLDVKKTIIETIKELPNSPGSVPEKYKQFREIQDRWKSTGPVPRAESNELWNNYHHHVDNFYDFLRISNELRELDFKKNLEAKTLLCEEAEALAEQDSNSGTFKQLQELHAKWKRTGPVDREHREPMWERFSEASKKVHDKRHEFYKSLQASREELIEKKKELVTKLKEIDFEKLKTHSAWQNKIKEVNKFRDEFKEIGRINLPENDVVWEEFREFNRLFNRNKNAFYKSLKGQHQENLKKKRELLARAIELKESTDWRNAAGQLKKIQSDWKRIGYVPKSESDKIWKEFRETCNHFFKRLTAHNKELDKAFEDNLTAKQAILERLKEWELPEGGKGPAMKELKAFIGEWKNAGRIPRAANEIETDFNKTLDAHFTQLKLNQKEASLIRFENKVHNLVEGENNRQLDREEEQLSRKIEEAKKELNQLENNIQFFAHADENNPIVKEANRQIDRQKEQIEILVSKMKMLRKMSN